MRERFIIWPEADADIAEAYHWYEGREPGAGKAFLAALLEIGRSSKRTINSHL